MTMPHLKPSPVHEASLKQALQRVEERIRRQEENRLKDERHLETIKLARKLADEGVRQRREQWEKEHRKKALADEVVAEAHMADAQAQHTLPAEDQASTSEKVLPLKGHSTPDEEVNNEQTIKEQTADDTLPGYDLEKLLNAFDASEHLEDTTQATLPVGPPLSQKTPTGRAKNKGLMKLMPAVAWLILCAGIIGAALSWATISAVWANPVGTGIAKNSTIPLGLLLGFAYLATGVLGFAFFWVSSQISNQLKEIRRLLFISTGQE